MNFPGAAFRVAGVTGPEESRQKSAHENGLMAGTKGRSAA